MRAPTNFEAMTRQTADDARRGQNLIIGPWWHRVNEHRGLNGIDFGEQAIIELDDYNVRFYDRWLKGKSNGIERRDAGPSLRDRRERVVGGGRLAAARDGARALLLPFRWHANSLKGDGGLSTDAPATEPARPVRLRPGRSRRDALEDARRPGRRPPPVDPRRRALLHERGAANRSTSSVRSRAALRHVVRARYRLACAARRRAPGRLRPVPLPRIAPAPASASRSRSRAAGTGRGLPLRIRDGRGRGPVFSRTPYPGRGDEQLVPEYDRNTNSGAENNFLDDHASSLPSKPNLSRTWT